VTYDEVADKLGVRLCPGVARAAPQGGCRFAGLDPARIRHIHQDGWADPATRIIHWKERRLVKAGLRNFLMRVALCDQPWLIPMTPWLRIWTINTYVDQLAGVLKVRLPRNLADGDRARLRFLLAEVPYDERAAFSGSYGKATRWAARD
jgi:hypothetical protein